MQTQFLCTSPLPPGPGLHSAGLCPPLKWPLAPSELQRRVPQLHQVSSGPAGREGGQRVPAHGLRGGF